MQLVNFTLTLSDDGVVYSFGRGNEKQLGFAQTDDVPFPTPISNLPKIQQVSCGYKFSICVDYEGFIWGFGDNNYGQLGTGNTTNFNVPQKIQDIPTVLSVACGSDHTLIITNDSNLWSCGNNEYGQLYLGNQENQSKYQQTSFTNISRISSGYSHSLFQNDNGEIYVCGHNKTGQLGLGHVNHPQITPIPIPNLPPNIVHFVCGYYQNLFLDSEGNVFSVGYNAKGSLGLGHNEDQNVLNQIPNIPPIQTISCSGYSSFLIDFEGNLWSFGSNYHGQLGNGNILDSNVPIKLESLKDIQQVSFGTNGNHFLAKDSQNTIFVAGNNYFGQLGRDSLEPILNPEKMESQYCTIWGINIRQSRSKSARK